MSYIGTAPTIGNFQVCDAISVVNGQASYTMQVGGVNATPQSANHMLVSLNGILQKPGSSFTVSGSTITFASNLVTGDVIDFIQILGDVLDLGVPSDATVSTAKIVDGAVTSAKLDSGVALGKVLQVLTATDTTERTTTSSTFVTGSNTMLINITPSSTSSKIFLISTFSGRVQGGGAMYTIYRDSTNIGATNGITRVYNAGDLYFNISMSILDAPSSTSQIAYQVYFNCQNGGTATVNSGNLKASLTAFEVGA